jgi:molybdopterin-guanine dinucleotide biosynthesis protein A
MTVSTPLEPEAVGLVLAGGRATRFGADKLAVELAGRPLLHHAIAAVASVTGRVMVSLAHGAPPPDLPHLARPVEVVRDRSADLGPLAGLAAALDAMAPSCSDQCLLVVAGDAPSLSATLLVGLIRALDGAAAAVLADGDDWRPLPFVVRAAAAKPIVRDRLAGPDRSLRGVLRALGPAIVDEAAWRSWDPDGAWRDDVDAPADLVRAAARERQETT